MTRELSTRVFIRDGWRCRHCKNRDGLHPHHVVYKSRGGKDEMNNIITLCWKCHRMHHDGHLDINVITVLESDLVVTFWRKS